MNKPGAEHAPEPNQTNDSPPRIGVLALQGDFAAHARALEEAGAVALEVRTPAQLAGLDGLILPGGESTTFLKFLERDGFLESLQRFVEQKPAFGTCAGLVLLSRRILDGRPDQRSFGVLDCAVRRNGYGRQRFSFEASVAVAGEGSMPAVFIRAPVVVELGPGVDVLATLDAGTDGPPDPVACRQGPVLATAFHPELTPDRRLHRLFAEMAEPGSSSRPPGGHW